MNWLIQLVDDIPYKKSVTMIVDSLNMQDAINKAKNLHPNLQFTVKVMLIMDLDLP